MPRLLPVDSLDEPALRPYRTLRRVEEHERGGIFVAEGPKVVTRTLEAGLVIESLLCTEKWRRHFWSRLPAQPADLPVFVADDQVLCELTGYHLFNGVLAVARVPPAPLLAELLANGPRPRLWVALDGLSNAENLGTVVRSAVALGAGAVLVGETCASPWLRRAVRTSMAAVLAVPVVRCSDLAAELRRLRAAGLRCFAAEAADAVAITAVDLTSDLCVVLGSEGHGARPTVRAACDATITIPMPGGFDSLNVGAAAAVVLYEAGRQRRASGGGERAVHADKPEDHAG